MLRFVLGVILRIILTLLLMPFVLPLLKAVGIDASWLVPQVGALSAPERAPAALQIVGATQPALQAVLVWLAITLALPMVTMDLLRSVVRKNNSALNACLLLVYIAIDLLLATTAFPLDTGWAAILMWTIVAALSVTYSLASMNLALHLEE